MKERGRDSCRSDRIVLAKQVELFTEADLRAMFSMYDVTRKGVISKEQFVSGTCGWQQRAATRELILSLLSKRPAIEAVGVEPNTVDIIPNTIEENSFVRIL